MSQENIEAFYQEVTTDTWLQQQISSAQDRESLIDLVVKLGSDKGYQFSREEVNQLVEEKGISAVGNDEELSDKQLEAVAGGKLPLIGELFK